MRARGSGSASRPAAATGQQRGDAELPKRPAQPHSVKITLCYQPSLNVCTSLATASPLAAYVLLRTGNNRGNVGYAMGAIGVANLCAAFPAAWLADEWSRTAVIRTAVIIGPFSFLLVSRVRGPRRPYPCKQAVPVHLRVDGDHWVLRRLAVVGRRGHFWGLIRSVL